MNTAALSKVTIFYLFNKNDKFEVLINPESLKFSRKVKYATDKVVGTSANVSRFDGHAPSNLNFSFVLDGTGVAYEKKESVEDTIKRLELVIYKYIGDQHQPNPLTVSWGNFFFNCRVESLDYEYTLFASNGEPLRVKVSASFSNFITREKEVKESDRKSPDLSRIITLKAGESILSWCNEIYGDASYCQEIAEYNKLDSFRNVKPGTLLMFPPLIR